MLLAFSHVHSGLEDVEAHALSKTADSKITNLKTLSKPANLVRICQTNIF